MQDDPFDHLAGLTLTPEQMAALPDKPTKGKRRERVREEFYLVPVGWFERAAAAVTTVRQLGIAVRLYRCWMMRNPVEETILATNNGLAGFGFSRKIKQRTLGKLAEAGLIEIVPGKARQSPRIRIMK